MVYARHEDLVSCNEEVFVVGARPAGEQRVDGSNVKLESSFRIPVPRDQVFDNFLDPGIMRQAVPGCSHLEKTSDTQFSGNLSNTIAHVRFDAAFAADITTLTPSSGFKATLSGEDRRLASTLRLEATVRFEADADSTVVTYTIEMAMWGKLGRMGEAIFRRRTVEVQGQFVEAFTRLCQGGVLEAAGSVSAAARTQSGAVRPATVRTRFATRRAAPFIAHRATEIGAVGSEPVRAGGVVSSNGGAPVTSLPGTSPRSRRRLSTRDRVEFTLAALFAAAATGFVMGRRSAKADDGSRR